MIIKKAIDIDSTKLVNGLRAALDIVGEIEQSDEQEITIDLSLVKFVSPLFVLSLMVYVNGCNKKINYINHSSYLKRIKFGCELQPDLLPEGKFPAYLKHYTSDHLIPIVSFSILKCSDNEKAEILTAVETIISTQLGLSRNVLSGMKYLIAETVDNIIQHSKSERGYIFAQAYPNNKYLDICIADNGITLLGSYLSSIDNEIEGDLEAIRAANRGISTKNLPGAENRGYGIITSKRMLIEGLSGSYLMISGGAMHMKNRELDRYFPVPQDLRWGGTIIALRIPYDNKSFQACDFYE